MIDTANSPAILAAQSFATQREGVAQQRTDAQPAAVDRATQSARAFADRGNGATETQTRQSVGAAETRDTAVSAEGSEANDRAQAIRERAPDESGQRPAPPPAGSGRGGLVDLFA